MAQNKLTSMGGNPVGLNISSLVTINFSNNPGLSSLDNAWLSLATNLRELNCNNCGLNSYSTDVKNLPTLSTIDFNQNNIKSIDTFGQLPALEKLYLESNQLTSDALGKTAFDDLFSLKVLQLDSNNLTTPYARWFKTPKSLSTLTWNNNPWNCDCNSWEFAQLQESEFGNPAFQRTIRNTVLCTAPTQFAGAYLYEVGVHNIFDTLNCTKPTLPPNFTTPAPSVCPDQCTCDAKNKYVDCSNRGLTAVPLLPNNARIVELQYNNIASFQASDFSSLNSLRKVDFSNNQLKQIPAGAFSNQQGLNVLDFHANSITQSDFTTSLPPNLNFFSVESNGISGNLNVPSMNYLSEIHLCHNDITGVSVNDDNSTVLPALIIFDADYTKMTKLPSIFNPNICYTNSLISMNGNGMTSIDQSIGSANAYTINLVANNINTLQTTDFNSKCVSVLALSSNGINTVQTDVFTQEHTPNLVQLQLDHNKLSSLPTLDTPRLRFLDLSSNVFQAIPAKYIPSSLITLNYANNQLTSIGGNPIGLNVTFVFDLTCCYLK
jgi:Leucine-rich repeat (LRR) protein